MENILIVSEKSWNKELVGYLQSTMPQYAFYLISQKEDFTVERIGSISPVKIFIPHWSYIIPSAIFERYECIVFHMTDLPYGRGGSPLIVEIIQNNLQPVPQEGDTVVFNRRKPAQSDMSGLEKLEEIFDYSRMLDADGYPHAYIEKGEFRYEFTRASIKADGSIVADVKITKK